MRGTLMRMFTPLQHSSILGEYPANKDAAAAYTEVGKVAVSPQNVAYWRRIFQVNNGNMAKSDRELKQVRKLQEAEPVSNDEAFNPEVVYDTILVVPDQHAPYHHEDALRFLGAVAFKFNPDLVVNLGDELDFHAMSFHDSDPNLDSAGVELEKGKAWLHKLAQMLPFQLVCDSNHGSMSFRKAKAHGLPVQLIRSYREVVFPNGGGDGWQWAESWRVKTKLGDVLFKHQTSGTILTDAAHNSANLMVGHNHGNFSIEYTASTSHLYWGCYSGCLIDKQSYAFAYGKHTLRKPVIGCTVILNGMPLLIPMLLNSKGRWVGSL